MSAVIDGIRAGRDPGHEVRLPLCRTFPLCLWIWAVASGLSVEAYGRAPTRRATLAGATTALASDRSEKVRVQAALVLGRAGDARAVPALQRALADPSPLVRAMAAKALGHLGGEESRPALEVAARDAHALVRRHATAALESLAERQVRAPVVVQPMGDRTLKASRELRERMRGFVADELRELGKMGGGGYTVDGAIKILSHSERSDMIEVKCGVELVLSRGGKAIVMMSSGEAIVQRQRRQFQPGAQASMEVEALRHAVRGASAELRQHFAANVP